MLEHQTNNCKINENIKSLWKGLGKVGINFLNIIPTLGKTFYTFFADILTDVFNAIYNQKINAKSITYDMQQQLISAEKDENSTDRVHTILVPVEAKIKEKTGNEGQP